MIEKNINLQAEIEQDRDVVNNYVSGLLFQRQDALNKQLIELSNQESGSSEIRADFNSQRNAVKDELKLIRAARKNILGF